MNEILNVARGLARRPHVRNGPGLVVDLRHRGIHWDLVEVGPAEPRDLRIDIGVDAPGEQRVVGKVDAGHYVRGAERGIQDAMKFPDLIHAAKPEPHFQMPQAATAHDTFWDFISLTPESTHVIMWVMSDRGIPRSFRMMQGFGVHTFRLVNAAGDSRFVKFHWSPVAGTHSVDWDEALKISGADPDPSPGSVGSDRSGRLPRMGAGPADLHRGGG
jgi:hypothetical protein